MQLQLRQDQQREREHQRCRGGKSVLPDRLGEVVVHEEVPATVAGLPREFRVLREVRDVHLFLRPGPLLVVLLAAYAVVVFVAVTVGVGDLVAKTLEGQRLGEILRESLLIGGWVAMWRPMEMFLYDWWPIRSEARLFDRLSAMPVRIAGACALTSVRR